MLSCKNLAYLTLCCHLPIIQRGEVLFSFFWVPVVWSLQTIMNNIHTSTQRKTNLPANLTSLSSQNASLSFLFFFVFCCGRRCNVMMRRPFCTHTLWLVAVAAPGVSDHRNKTRWEWIMGLNRTRGCHPHSINGWVLSLKGSDASFETRSARRLSVPAILPQCRISDEPVDTEAVCVRTNNLQPYGLKHASRDCIGAHHSSFLFSFFVLCRQAEQLIERIFFSRVISREFSLATF